MLNESIVEDAALEWLGEQSRLAPPLIPAFSQREKEAGTGCTSRPVNMPEAPSPRPVAFGYLRCAPVPKGRGRRKAARPSGVPQERDRPFLAIPRTLCDPAAAGLPKLLSGELCVAEAKTSR